MGLTVHQDAIPLRVDETGTVRIGKTRMLLDLVIHAFRDGAMPEEIVQMYDSLDLADTYAVIGYYLRHREEVDEYLKQREWEAEELWKKIDVSQRHLPDIRQRLLAARRKRMHPDSRRFHDEFLAGIHPEGVGHDSPGQPKRRPR